ncbi:hypothetical protein ABCS02_19785 [Microbacterium sp. X-17]|uniref:hypothetical protein n=1 Tax=Microbacterium sp. X-17 TaxID=3144404 RepID=UPI0031F5C44F
MRRLRATPWLWIGIVYVLSRLVTTGFFALAANASTSLSRFGARPSLGDLFLGWDAQWYWFTAVNGYPSSLPLTQTGAVAENQWAFMPLYSYLSAAVGAPFGSWGVGGVLVSLVAGYLSCLVLYRMLRMRLPAAASAWAVVFFAAGPLAAMFQVAYAESLALLWLFLGLWLVMRRRYAWLFLLIPLMAFTRPGVLAFALMLGLLLLWRVVRRRREALPVREAVLLGAAAAWAAVLGFAWQWIAGIATGDPGAYLVTELAWRRNWIPDSGTQFLPFDGFLEGVRFWFTAWGPGPVVGYIVLGALILGVAALLLFEPHVRKLGIELRLWTASYLLYLLAVFFPQSSVFRLLLPVSPLFGALAVPRSRAWRIGVLVVCLLGQWWWIYNMYGLGNTYWQIP